jgi:uncharacterized protein DUF4166
VERGAGPLSRLLGALAGAPPAGDAIPFELRIARGADTERWERRFGGRPLVTTQRARGRLLAERTRVFEVRFALEPGAGEALAFRQTGFLLALGPLRVPLPRFLSPRLAGRTWADGDAVGVDVTLEIPRGGLVLRYNGLVRIEDGA